MSKINLKKVIKYIAIGFTACFAVTSIIAKLKKNTTTYKNEPSQKNPMEGKTVSFVYNEDEPENADGVRGHLEAIGNSDYKPGFYEKYVKRGIDILLSFGGLVVLSPFLLGISVAIIIDDPGPVLFTQKRLGKNKEYFKLHKFRSMKMCTPHDVPTHMLDNPEQYITKVGKFLRAHSLDELPQIWDIFMGNMSVIGPRPGLWNQDLLTSERDKYQANDVRPGLTGWAQINGRDELEIPDKAKLDGYYVAHMGLWMDIKVFLGSLHVFGKDDSVVEGGTGEMKKGSAKEKIGRHYTDGKSAQELIGHIGFGDPVEVDTDGKKKVLITGAGSYIGESFIAYAKEKFPALEVEELDMLDGSWREKDFSGYDIVYHVAGIAHADVGNVDDETKEKYYAINTDLTVEVCRKAKMDGVKEFIFMSSMIVYGDSAPYGKRKMIDANTVPNPANFYGDSKLQADVAVRALADDQFKVIVLRPPMIYGKGSKGNYPILAKFAKKLPIFPDVNNERSMLYIENLCEFLCQIMLVKKIKENAIVLIPQNGEWSRTSDMVRMISEASGKKIKLLKILKPAVWIGGKVPGKIGGMVNKALGSNCYKEKLSKYEGVSYQINTVMQSIKITNSENDKRKKVLFLVNHDVVIYNFRLEIVERLLTDGYEVHISSPYGERIDDLVKLGAKFHEITMSRHGMNPKDELKLLNTYKKLMKEVKPDICFGFTIKPNIYGAMATAKYNIPFVANITGLGTAVENPGMSQKIMLALYKVAFRKIQRVFFQNTENRQFFIDHNIAVSKHDLLPGSGVNLSRYIVKEYPNDGVVRFAFISRIMKEKGIDYYLDAAKEIRKRYPNTEFHICGFCESEYEGKLNEDNDDGTVIYHGMIRDVAGFMSEMSCIIHPTYYPEGISNVLLESAACGRPIITTDRSGCREVVDDGVNGYMIPCQDGMALIDAIEKFLSLSVEERKAMGLNGRKKVEREFDRQIVVQKYVDEVDKVRKG